MLELDVKIEAGDLYDYMMAHTYNSSTGILGSCMGGVLVVMALTSRKWILLFCGMVLLLYLPCSLYAKSKKQALTNPAFRSSLHYVLDENGITVELGKERQSQSWGNMYKAISTTKSIIVYTSPVNATIIPRRVLGENLSQCIEIISTHMPPAKVKIRY